MNATRPLLIVATASLLVSSTLAGCAGPAQRAPDPDPAEVVRAYHRALHEGRPDQAWALLDTAARDGLDEAGFVELYARQREALVAQAEALVAVVDAAPAAETAQVLVGDVELTLVRSRDGWQVRRIGAGPAAPGPR